jgi:flagellar motor protein MotB
MELLEILKVFKNDKNNNSSRFEYIDMNFSSRIFNKPKSIDSENPYWISFSDIMAGMLLVFILAILQLIVQLSQMQSNVVNAIQEIQETNQVRNVMLDEIKDTLSREGTYVQMNNDKTVLRIPDNQLYFETLSYKIPENKKPIIANIGKALYRGILKNDRFKYIDTIFIEGHTDGRPARNLAMGNWGLSTYRAIAIWKFWSEELDIGNSLKNLKNVSGNPLFSVSGYGATRKLIQNENTADKQRKNRRIDIRFSMRKPVIVDYEGVLNLF